MSQKNTLENFSVDQLEQMILELNRLKAQRLTEEKKATAETTSLSGETLTESSDADEFVSEEEAPKPRGVDNDYNADTTPVCCGCKLPLFADQDSPRDPSERAAEVFGDLYHQECLTCGFCQKTQLESYALLQTERKVVCKNCAETIFVCHECKEPIQGTEFNKYEDGRYVHHACVKSKLCGACEKPVRADEQHFTAAECWFHRDCFACYTCKKTIEGRFNRSNGRLQCESCLEKMYQCAACKKGIAGRYLKLTNGDLLHPECAPKDTCEACKGDITMNMEHMDVMGKKYHATCLRCVACDEQIEGQFGMKGGKFCCARCLGAK